MMKKVACILFVILLLMQTISLAEDEIMFQGIPWLSDEKTTMQMLSDKGFSRESSASIPIISTGEAMYIVSDDTGFVSPYRVMQEDDFIQIADLSGYVKGRIAGYPVKSIYPTFAYNGNYQLIAIQIEFVNATYDELKNKLIKVYGEGEHVSSDEGVDSSVWKGANNSIVLLYTQTEGLEYTLIYGRLDAAEILSQCATSDSEDISGL